MRAALAGLGWERPSRGSASSRRTSWYPVTSHAWSPVAVRTRWTGPWAAAPKSVASNTLTKATGHTTILRREAAGQIADLKSWSRGNLLLMCGPSLLAALSDRGLVDRYMLDVSPIALG